jgi:hypothetical protein
MTRLEMPMEDLEDIDSERLTPEEQFELSKDTGLIVEIQKRVMEELGIHKGDAQADAKAVAWGISFAKNFKQHFVYVPENAVLLRDYKNAENEFDKSRIIKKIAEELYGVSGIFGAPSIPKKEEEEN